MKRRMKCIFSGLLAAVCLLPCVGCGERNQEETMGESSPELLRCEIAAAEYPKMAAYPDEAAFTKPDGTFDDEGFSEAYDIWCADQRAQSAAAGNIDGLENYFDRCMRQFLSGGEGENRVCSPLNIYMALAMLAELTDGDSRQEILSLLGAESSEALREQAGMLWRACYRADGAVSSILAGSVWLNEDIPFVQETLQRLAEFYYASSYQGEMGSAEMDAALQEWLNEQTGGLLKDQIGGIRLDRETVLALATTVYFRAKWSDTFYEGATENAVFHGAAGDSECAFLHQSGSGSYYWGEHFSAIFQRLENGGGMWLILPDEGITPEELLQDEEVTDFLHRGGDWENRKFLTVNRSIPKFDISGQTDLRAGLQELGVRSVFDPETSDFTPMTEAVDGIFLSQALHGARVAIDEEGCTAAAYTVMAVCGSCMPPEETVDFVLDRPFLFVLTAGEKLPLFAGIVNQIG